MSSTSAYFRTLNLDCDVQAAFTYKKGMKATVAHLLKWSFPNGGDPLEATTSVPDPMDPEGNKIMVIGAFSRLRWNGKPDDPIEFAFVVNPKNGGDLQTRLLKSGREINWELALYKYDPVPQKQVKLFHFDTKELKCQVMEGTTIEVVPYSAPGGNDGYLVTGILQAKNGLSEEQSVTVEFTAGSPQPLPFGTPDASA